MKVLLVALALLCLAEISFADKVQTIRTKTDSCALCGMSAGELSIKVRKRSSLRPAVALRVKRNFNIQIFKNPLLGLWQYRLLPCLPPRQR